MEKNLIQKSWSAKIFSVPPNSAPGLRHCLVLFYLGEVCRPLFLCSRPPYTAVFCPWRFGVPVCPLCGNAEPSLFNGSSNNLAGRLSDQRHLTNGACSHFSQLLKTVLFRFAWVGSSSG